MIVESSTATKLFDLYVQLFCNEDRFFKKIESIVETVKQNQDEDESDTDDFEEYLQNMEKLKKQSTNNKDKINVNINSFLTGAQKNKLTNHDSSQKLNPDGTCANLSSQFLISKTFQNQTLNISQAKKSNLQHKYEHEDSNQDLKSRNSLYKKTNDFNFPEILKNNKAQDEEFYVSSKHLSFYMKDKNSVSNYLNKYSNKFELNQSVDDLFKDHNDQNSILYKTKNDSKHFENENNSLLIKRNSSYFAKNDSNTTLKNLIPRKKFKLIDIEEQSDLSFTSTYLNKFLKKNRITHIDSITRKKCQMVLDYNFDKSSAEKNKLLMKIIRS